MNIDLGATIESVDEKVAALNEMRASRLAPKAPDLKPGADEPESGVTGTT